jgi:predicted enzyme related to lactoylglutathione lyase
MTTVGRTTPGLWCLALAGILTLALGGVAAASSHGEPGEVQWWDLLSEDAAGAARFYSQLLGWDIERGPKNTYVVRLGGTPIAGISQIGDALPGVSETTWVAGITVSDIAAASAAARRLGARKYREGRTDGFGPWAAFEDPQGAPVLLAVPEQALGRAKGPGAWLWAELWTREPDASVEFYEAVVGYERSTVDRPGGPYPVFRSGGEARAGIVPIENDRIETAWAPYVGVADIEATLKRALELGGRVLLEPHDDLAEGRVALVADPSGGAFFVYELEEAAK